MIRLVHLLRRGASTDGACFEKHLRDVHGPLVASHQASLGLVRYVQTHRDVSGQDLDIKAGEVRGGTLPPFEALDEYWWRSEQALLDILGSAAGQNCLAQISRSLAHVADRASSPLWLAHEYPQVATALDRPVAALRTGIMRLHFAFHGLPALSVEEAQTYWLTRHGPLVRSHSRARGLVAYNQVHRFDSPVAERMREIFGSEAAPYIGHAEAWFDRLQPRGGPEAQDATDAAVADERNFIDWQRSTILVGKESVFVNREWA